MRPRIPLAYAGLLIVALVAVVGFAAFSPSSDSSATPTPVAETDETAPAPNASARVASAILALRVTDTAPANAVTSSSSSSSSSTTEDTVPETLATEIAESTTTEPSTTSTAPTTTAAPTTTQPKDTTPPALRITSPADGATVTDRVVTFKGTSEPGADVYSGPYDADVDGDGDWSIKLVVGDGETTARITAKDAAGNTTTESITVVYEQESTPPPPTTTTTTSGGSSTPKWSPLWPADPGGTHDVEYWRPLVASIWPDHLVNCALNIIYYESRGDARAYNSSGAGFEGLFQHHSGYWKGRAAAAGYRDSNGLYATPYNAEANIAVSWYLASNSDPWDRHWSVNPRNGPLECNE